MIRIIALSTLFALTACHHPVRTMGNAGIAVDAARNPSRPLYTAPAYVPPRQTICNAMGSTLSCTTY